MQAYGRRVAVIGAGPSGLAAARHLKAHGFDPVIYDQGDRLDTASAAPATGAEGPRRIARFSDFADSAATRSEGDVAAYLARYAEMFGLTGGLRHDTIVETLARHPTGGWVVHSVKRGEAPRTELYPRVVVAAGRFSGPAHPAIPGIDGFSGCCGVLHSSDYRGPEPFTGKRVLVAGSSIAALEIASDLAVSGAAHVFSTAWQQRCVLQKAGGASGENVARTRFRHARRRVHAARGGCGGPAPAGRPPLRQGGGVRRGAAGAGAVRRVDRAQRTLRRAGRRRSHRDEAPGRERRGAHGPLCGFEHGRGGRHRLRHGLRDGTAVPRPPDAQAARPGERPARPAGPHVPPGAGGSRLRGPLPAGRVRISRWWSCRRAGSPMSGPGSPPPLRRPPRRWPPIPNPSAGASRGTKPHAPWRFASPDARRESRSDEHADEHCRSGPPQPPRPVHSWSGRGPR